MTRRTLLVIGLAGLLFLGTARAQDEKKDAPEDPKAQAVDQIEKGKAALLADKAQEAIDHLQKAISLIQKGVKVQLASFMPAAPDGFERGDVNSDSGSWGMGEQSVQFTTADCTYTRKSDGVEVQVQFSNSPQILQGIRQMIEMYGRPEYQKIAAMSGGMTMEKLDSGGFKAWLLTQKDSDTRIIAACEGAMIQITAPEKEGAAAKAIWAAIDKAGLAKIAPHEKKVDGDSEEGGSSKSR